MINQFGFRNEKFFDYTIGEVTDYIRKEVDKRRSDTACFFDSKKAFDTSDRTKLLEIFFGYGFRGPIFRIIKIYLSDRKQYVMQSGNILTILFLKTGVPQQSVLGPLHFLVSTNDLPEQGNQSLISLFADDTTVYKTTPNATKGISSDIQNIRKQFDMKKLTVSTKKSDGICFRRVEPFGKEPFSLEGLCKNLFVIVD